MSADHIHHIHQYTTKWTVFTCFVHSILDVVTGSFRIPCLRDPQNTNMPPHHLSITTDLCQISICPQNYVSSPQPTQRAFPQDDAEKHLPYHARVLPHTLGYLSGTGLLACLVAEAPHGEVFELCPVVVLPPHPRFPGSALISNQDWLV